MHSSENLINNVLSLKELKPQSASGRIIRKIGKSESTDNLESEACNMETTTVQVRQRGSLTLPVSMREKYGIKTGDSFQLVDLDGIFILTPMTPMVPELAREIDKIRQEAGLSMEELLQGLREQRSQYQTENDADA
jgi:bifunctional DNA-binding transcriptional regulator/antitoxin component of YhaV-PrlF toxin-antitoxin module